MFLRLRHRRAWILERDYMEAKRTESLQDVELESIYRRVCRRVEVLDL